ncbi:hypothetical protein ACN9KI_03610 [Aliarcobacter butzleri]|uniref:hypothetical protein n=1 Tax=Aliarcobacter butzleri TaxID=28197 RepID=UPI003B21D88E
MKKIILILIMVTSLFSSEVTSKAGIGIDLELNDNAKLLIDCSIKVNKLFGFITGIFYDENEYINEFKETICLKKSDSKTHEINFKDLNSALSKISENHNYRLNIYKRIKIQNFAELFEKEIILNLKISKSSPFSNKSGWISLNVISLLNNQLSVSRSFSLSGIYKKDDYLIKSYKYDYVNKKILDLQLDKPFENLQNEPIVFTNTYDIDDIRECIEGEVWIKKYGAKADIPCPYIEKKEVEND